MNKKNRGGVLKKQEDMDLKDHRMEIKSIMKDIELLGSSHMTWKERKDLENKKVVSLGGKPQKKQRLPLSVAKVPMKRQKEREQKMMQEKLILGRFGGGGQISTGGSKRQEKRKPEDRGLKSTEGYFRNGVLDVKHLLHTAPAKESRINTSDIFEGGKKNTGGKKSRGKKKGGGRKRR